MAAMKTKIAYGAKNNISNAISEGTIDSGDIVFTSDTNEAAFITSDGVPNFVKSRSTKSYTLNGTTLGALANGDTIPTDIDMDGLLNLITQKAIAPTYSNPTISIVNSSGTASGTYETGTEITPKVKATFTQNDAGGLTTIKVFKNDTVEVGSGTASPYTYNGEAFILGDETVKYEARASYEAGNPKANNLGVYDETGLAAGTVESSEYKFTGQRNLFYGTGVGSTPELTSAIVRALTNKKLNPTQNYSFNITVDIGQQYILFAYPATLRDVNQVMYVETNDTGMAESFTKTLVDIADARGTNEDGSLNGPMSYKVYSYAMAAPAAAKMTFKVTI